MAKKSGNSRGFRKYIGLLWLVLMFPILAIFIIVGGTAAGFFGELPSFEELENPNSSLASEIYSSDLKLLGKYYIQNRSNVHYNELSPNLVNALKATEDIRFEEHSGVDLRGLGRVFVKTVILRQDAGGGSTISQQLAKNLFPRERMNRMQLIARKIKEWIIAVRLERNYTKEEILAMYLNTVDFGSNAYGIKSASSTFFKKQPSELNLQESALLVGLLKGPSLYSPVRNPDNAKGRRNVVITQLEKYKFITSAQSDSIKKLPIKLNYQQEGHTEGIATYFRETLRQDLLKWCREHRKQDGTAYNLYTDGIRIYTTIDTRMQKAAEEAVKEHMSVLQKTFIDHWKGKTAWSDYPELIDETIKRSERYRVMKAAGASAKEIDAAFKKKVPMTVFTWKGERDTVMSPVDSIKYYKMFLRTGFMSMEPQTGYIRAWVGGNDYKYFQYDQVKEGKRQVGSTFKPFLYTLAMQEGFSPCYEVPNVPVTIIDGNGDPWTPSNSDGEYGGMKSLKEALALSINAISAYLMKQFGPEAVIQVARKMGITSPIEAVPSIALGTADVSVFEMVGAYSAFANKGVWSEPTYILRIEDKNGVVLQDFVPRKVEAISEETAYLMLNLMQGVTQFGTGARLRGSKYGFTNPIAGKTGTTQNNSDGWFMGIVPDLVSGCWVGAEDRAVHFRTTQLGQGANTALPIWGLYMKKIYEHPELEYSKGAFDPPERPLSVELDCSKYQNKSTSDPLNDFGIE